MGDPSVSHLPASCACPCWVKLGPQERQPHPSLLEDSMGAWLSQTGLRRTREALRNVLGPLGDDHCKLELELGKGHSWKGNSMGEGVEGRELDQLWAEQGCPSGWNVGDPEVREASVPGSGVGYLVWVDSFTTRLICPQTPLHPQCLPSTGRCWVPRNNQKNLSLDPFPRSPSYEGHIVLCWSQPIMVVLS